MRTVVCLRVLEEVLPRIRIVQHSWRDLIMYFRKREMSLVSCYVFGFIVPTLVTLVVMEFEFCTFEFVSMIKPRLKHDSY